MNIVRTIARILLGLVFTATGASAFFMSGHPPVPPLAGAFLDVISKSHWALFLAVAQLVMGVLLLTNRFVPVALIMVAAFLYNSFAFHITMLPSALFAPVAVLVLWLIVALPYRRLFAPIFRAKPVIPSEAKEL
jgi:putative oxidoreductase